MDARHDPNAMCADRYRCGWMTPLCERVAGRAIMVIQAGQRVDVGRSQAVEDYAVAAVCCCHRPDVLATGSAAILGRQ